MVLLMKKFSAVILFLVLTTIQASCGEPTTSGPEPELTMPTVNESYALYVADLRYQNLESQYRILQGQHLKLKNTRDGQLSEIQQLVSQLSNNKALESEAEALNRAIMASAGREHALAVERDQYMQGCTELNNELDICQDRYNTLVHRVNATSNITAEE